MRRRLWRAAAALTVAALTACDKKTLDSWFPRNTPGAVADEQSLFEPAPLAQGMSALRKRLKSPIQALSLLIYPDRLVLQARDPNEPTRIDEYVYEHGHISDPARVKLLGSGRLEHNVFSLDAADLNKVPALIEEARKEMRTPDSKITRVLLKRNLPESMDIQFRVFINSPRRDTHIDADKDGELID